MSFTCDTYCRKRYILSKERHTVERDTYCRKRYILSKGSEGTKDTDRQHARATALPAAPRDQTVEHKLRWTDR
eukprot:6203193-Pleurochrysis_carterae.AAC.1